MPNFRLAALVSIAVAAGLAVSCSAPPAAQSADPAPRGFDRALVAKGAQLASIGNCRACHTAPDAKPYAGGYPLKTAFGTVYGSNITPDPDTGIGRWSEADFTRAMREGVAPEGHHYYPAFPYDYFTRLQDDDIHALFAFVMTREPVRNTPPANRMLVPRFAVAFWKQKYFDRSPFRPDPARDARWNRGAYLAEALAHCSACHTPRNKLGAERRDEYMSGGDAGGWHAPALNEHSPSPVPWNADSLTGYLSTGLVDDHAIAAGPMRSVVSALAHVPRDEVRAIAVYTASLDARSAKPVTPARATLAAHPPGSALANGAALYAGACADCHDRGREAEGGALRLPLAIALTIPTPANLIHITRDGIVPGREERHPWMPEFASALTEEQLTDLVVYLRALGGRPPWQDVRAEVRKISRGGE
jgi:mono/diheme cytochrome c family protein